MFINGNGPILGQEQPRHTGHRVATDRVGTDRSHAPGDQAHVSSDALQPQVNSSLSNLFHGLDQTYGPSGGVSANAAHHHKKQKSSNSGRAAVRLAKKYLGRSAINLRGHLKHYQAAGGVTNDCADFVSAVEMDTGRLKHHEINVAHMRQDLPHEGWHEESKSQARPGDIVIFPDYHTEIVANKGAGRLIGSNGTSVETISYTGSWSPAVYFGRDKGSRGAG